MQSTSEADFDHPTDLPSAATTRDSACSCPNCNPVCYPNSHPNSNPNSNSNCYPNCNPNSAEPAADSGFSHTGFASTSSTIERSTA